MSMNDNAAKAIKPSENETAKSADAVVSMKAAASQETSEKSRKPAKPKSETAKTGSDKNPARDPMQSSHRVWPD